MSSTSSISISTTSPSIRRGGEYVGSRRQRGFRWRAMPYADDLAAVRHRGGQAHVGKLADYGVGDACTHVGDRVAACRQNRLDGRVAITGDGGDIDDDVADDCTGAQFVATPVSDEFMR
ncbi:hypothetical protein [Mycolicibacterium setense]|jgi:hypothetical protein